MPSLKNGSQSSSSKGGGASGRGRKLTKKEQKRQLALKRKKQMMLGAYLLVEGQHIDDLLLSVNSMLTATRDLIQNNNVIPIESIRALKEQNEILRKEIEKLSTSIYRKFS